MMKGIRVVLARAALRLARTLAPMQHQEGRRIHMAVRDYFRPLERKVARG